MKNMYTWSARPVRRNLTVADLRAAQGERKLVQVTANSEEEASAAATVGGARHRDAGGSRSAAQRSSRLSRLCTGRSSSTCGRRARIPAARGSNPS